MAGRSENFFEVSKVCRRARFDPMSLSSVRDFRDASEGVSLDRDAASKLLERQAEIWTPYCLAPLIMPPRDGVGAVAMIACPAEVDLTAAPFFYQAQFQHAERIALMDPATFIALGDQFNRRFDVPVMIYSTGRAGTTLVSKMFARLECCHSISEPDLHTCVQAHCPPELQVDILRAGTKLYFQPRHKATHLVLKFRGMCVELAPQMREAFPNVREMFLYRDAENYVRSSIQAFGYFGSPLWAIRWLHRLYVTRPLLKFGFSLNYDLMCRFFPLVADYPPRELARLGPVGLLTLSWLSMMHRALIETRSVSEDSSETRSVSEGEAPSQPALAHASGSDKREFLTLRYETLMADPRAAMERVLSHCCIPPSDVETALAALDQDSQRGSVVGRERRGSYELSRRDRDEIRAVLERHPVINRPDFEL
jgi:hypothetical protein